MIPVEFLICNWFYMGRSFHMWSQLQDWVINVCLSAYFSKHRSVKCCVGENKLFRVEQNTTRGFLIQENFLLDTESLREVILYSTFNLLPNVSVTVVLQLPTIIPCA